MRTEKLQNIFSKPGLKLPSPITSAAVAAENKTAQETKLLQIL